MLLYVYTFSAYFACLYVLRILLLFLEMSKLLNGFQTRGRPKKKKKKKNFEVFFANYCASLYHIVA